MFRTLQGFFETARLNLSPNRGLPADERTALAWARYDDVELVPGQASAK